MEANIIVVGLGPGSKEHLSLGAWDIIRNADNLFLRTTNHPVVEWFDENGIDYRSFDEYYDKCSSFEKVYKSIANSILTEAKSGTVVFAVPGHPLVAEKSVEIIMELARQKQISVKVIPGISFVDLICTYLGKGIDNRPVLVDGLKLETWKPDLTSGYIIYQVFDRLIAADVKIELLEYYPPEFMVQVIRAVGISDMERIESVPLYKIDRFDWIDHLTSIYIPPLSEAELGKVKAALDYSLDPIIDVMARLRSEDGCPWDKEQDHISLIPYLLEETHEVIDALQQGDMYKICEELGDLLLQIVFHAQIASENKCFNMNDVVKCITDKMIRRHPHVFGNTIVDNSDQVLNNWDKIKKSERDGSNGLESVLDGIPRGLPSLLKSSKIQKKVARLGFDWPDYKGALEKINEELCELLKAYHSGDKDMVQQEVGDLLFSVVNLSRIFGVEAEIALNGTVERFINRYKYIEHNLQKQGKIVGDCNLEYLDMLWEEAKKIEKRQKTRKNFHRKKELPYI